MSEQEAVAYIEEWDVTEAAKVLKWYEEEELLRPCDCDTMVAIETEDLKAENAKLREELAKACDPQRIGGQADPSSFAYAIEQLREFRWQHATNDEDAIPYINNVAAAHERENSKLRELVQDMWYWLAPIAVGCGVPMKGLRRRVRELGIEVRHV